MVRRIMPLLLMVLTCVPLRAQEPELSWRRPEPVEVFDAVWELARDRFYDPGMNGVDWPAARERHRADARAAESPEDLSEAIDALLAELGASHTARYTPDEATYYHLLDVFGRKPELRDLLSRSFPRGVRYDGLEAWLERDGDSLVVTGLWYGGNADRAGLFTGDEILAVDGESPHPIRSFREKGGKEATLTVRRRPREDPREIVVPVVSIRPNLAFLNATQRSVRVLDHAERRIGYIQIPSYASSRVQDVLVREMFDGKFREADALLIDIRGGIGGASPSYVDPFLPGPVLTMRSRSGEVSVEPRRWTRPVGLLIDEGTRSGKEVIAHAFRKYNLGPVIGENTAGAVLGGTVFVLPDDSILSLAVVEVEVDGARIEGAGVEPDIGVSFDPKHAADVDPQLERALDELAERAAARETNND